MFGIPLINISAIVGALGLSIAMWMPVKLALVALGLPVLGGAVMFAGAMSTLIWMLLQLAPIIGF